MSTELEIVPDSKDSNSSLQALEAASIDMQISTAKKYPRDIQKVKVKMMQMACLDEETAEGCFYTLKRKGKGGEEKIIQGPSIRLAEIAATAFGNIRSGARVLSNNGKVIVCQGVCHDLENNVFYSMEASRRITTRDGYTYSDDMQVTTANAGCAIALRNAITKAVPLALIKPVMEAAKQRAVGDVKSIATKRDKVISKLKQMGANLNSILAAVDCSKVEEITVDKLETLIGLGTALKEGETTLEEAFPEVGGKLHSAGKEQEPAPGKPEPEKQPSLTPQNQLSGSLAAAGIDFTAFVTWGLDSGNFMDPPKSYADIPDAEAKRLLRCVPTIVKNFEMSGGGK